MTTTEHDQIWNTRLQDWLDDELADGERAQFETHLDSCPLCQSQLRSLEELDSQLRTALPTLELGPSFDTRVWAQVNQFDEARRAALRARLEREWQHELKTLSGNWRRTLLLVVPGIAAGIALAFAIVSCLGASEATQALVREGAQTLGQSSSMLNATITTLIGAGIGATVARWFASLTS
jgi:anti-sigma factor RsiW